VIQTIPARLYSLAMGECMVNSLTDRRVVAAVVLTASLAAAKLEGQSLFWKMD
jgi:hypothetical protein